MLKWKKREFFQNKTPYGPKNQTFLGKKGRKSYWLFLTNKLVQRRGIFIPDLKKIS